MKPLYCPIRARWVAALPEEQVRQQLLALMLGQLGYPKSLIAVERALSLLPHLYTAKVPDRRADILCFAKAGDALTPLLLIECKAIPLTAKVINQVAGYNHFVRAPYIAIANQTQVRTGWYDPKAKAYAFVSRLPTYAEIELITKENYLDWCQNP
jgi:Type I restriction enzyme R protein N terminus (HSDR_N)